MNATEKTYIFGRIGRSNTVHMFEQWGTYKPTCVCGSNGWHHNKVSDVKLTEKDVTCKRCLIRLETMQRQEQTIQNIMSESNQTESTASETLLEAVEDAGKALDDFNRSHNSWVMLSADEQSEYEALVKAENDAIRTYNDNVKLTALAPDTLAENRKREELLLARIAKLEGDLEAAGNIIIEASKQVETLKTENEALSSAIAESPIVEVLSKQVQDLQVHLSFILGYTESAANSLSNPKRDNFREIAKRCEVALGKQSASTESAQKKVVSKRMRVNWSGCGFSSGDYEVLGHSQEKQAYVLNISSDAQKPMPKWVKFSDCQ